ncbi:MAG: TraB/GumN family protein [Saprospiraceae bacterium]|nr:TraB/GumN family protein [Bacteroidia bacterium]NNE13971.1 TraB/GumN family protein [Saprospiraceae bacterium]NNL92769.1 TraB/GumN family protein [Saprospiraceae bacterium]
MLKKSLLWKLTKEEGPTSFLFGTMHVKDEAAFTFAQKAINHLQMCDSFYAEMDLNEASTAIKPTDYLMDDNMSLKNYFKEKKYAKYKRIVLKSFSLNLDNYQYLKPIIILNNLAESVMSSDNARPLDHFLWHQAELLNLKLGGLETVDEQVSTLKSLEIELQLKMLKKALKNISSFKSSNQILKTLYAQQDIIKIFKLSNKGLGKLRQPLLYVRNRIMADRIAQYANKRSFFAVGAAHLGGNKGVLKLLKSKGFKLKPL